MKKNSKHIELSGDQLEEIFNVLDLNNDRIIDKHEVEQMLKKLQLPAGPQEIQQVFDSIPANVAEGIGTRQFKSYLKAVDERINKTFLEMTADGKCIDFKTFKNGVQKHFPHRNVSSQTVRSIFSQLDFDQDGCISLSEWRRALALLPRASVWTAFDEFHRAAITEDPIADSIDAHFNPFKYLISGAVSGVVSRTSTAPLSRIKILLQVNAKILTSSVVKKSANAAPVRATIFDAAKAIYLNGGVASFWRGNFASVLETVPSASIVFFSFEMWKNAIARDKFDVTSSERFVAGSLAGVTSSAINFPLDLLHTRIAAAPTGTYSGLLHCLHSTVKLEGIGGLYKGLVPSLIGVVPLVGTNMTVYEGLKRKYAETSSLEPSVPVLLGCGALASCAGTAVSYPFALVRTKLQADGIRKTGNVVNAEQSLTMLGTFRSVLVADGLPGFYRGYAAALLKSIPAISISYAVYETTARMFDENEKK